MSGGNTLIVDVKGYTDMEVLGATRDDAAGECFDKAARVLGLPYPGGKPMDRLAAQSPGGKYVLPRAHVEGAPLDMSFSGLKTAVVNLAHNAQQKEEPLDAAALAGRSVGISIFPQTAYVPNSSLVTKYIAGSDKSLEYLFVWRKGHSLPVLEERFIDHIKEHILP